MMEAIGFLELNSIAAGVEAADVMLKAADVELAQAGPTCPGKYTILVFGDVGAVKSSVEAGVYGREVNIIEHLVIPKIHPQVTKAINRSTMPDKLNAVGIIECFSITASVVAADNAVKASDITLIEVRLGTGLGGKSFVVITGDLSSVEEAVKCGAETCVNTGMLMGTTVIPNPRPELFERLL